MLKMTKITTKPRSSGSVHASGWDVHLNLINRRWLIGAFQQAVARPMRGNEKNLKSFASLKGCYRNEACCAEIISSVRTSTARVSRPASELS